LCIIWVKNWAENYSITDIFFEEYWKSWCFNSFSFKFLFLRKWFKWALEQCFSTAGPLGRFYRPLVQTQKIKIKACEQYAVQEISVNGHYLVGTPIKIRWRLNPIVLNGRSPTMSLTSSSAHPFTSHAYFFKNTLNSNIYRNFKI
jgi:hypothetical protein